MSWLNKCIKVIAESPKLRLAVNLGCTIFVGVFCSILAAKIAPNGDVDVTKIGLSWTTLIFVLVCLFTFFIQYKLMDIDQDIMSYLDSAKCQAFVNKMKIDGMAEHIRANPQEAIAMNVNEIMKKFGRKS